MLKGEFAYGTAFGGTPAEEASRTLIEAGFSYSGKDYLTSGITGEALEAYVYMGCAVNSLLPFDGCSELAPLLKSDILSKAQAYGFGQNARPRERTPCYAHPTTN